MRYRCIFDLDAPLFAEIKKFRASEIGPQVGYDAIRYSEPEYYVLYEFHCLSRSQRSDGLVLYPLSEFINSNQYMSVSPLSFIEGSNHIQPYADIFASWLT